MHSTVVIIAYEMWPFLPTLPLAVTSLFSIGTEITLIWDLQQLFGSNARIMRELRH